MTTSGYGQIRATDADRERVHSALQAAYADGRLTWDEFEARSTTLLNARTHGEIVPLTADLRMPIAYQPQAGIPSGSGGTNSLAVVSMVCGILQLPFWLASGIPAIICGHIARRQIRRTGQQGSGMALTGLILGYTGLVLSILFIAAFILLVAAVSHTGHVVHPQPRPPLGGP